MTPALLLLFSQVEAMVNRACCGYSSPTNAAASVNGLLLRLRVSESKGQRELTKIVLTKDTNAIILSGLAVREKVSMASTAEGQVSTWLVEIQDRHLRRVRSRDI